MGLAAHDAGRVMAVFRVEKEIEGRVPHPNTPKDVWMREGLVVMLPFAMCC